MEMKLKKQEQKERELKQIKERERKPIKEKIQQSVSAEDTDRRKSALDLNQLRKLNLDALFDKF